MWPPCTSRHNDNRSSTLRNTFSSISGVILAAAALIRCFSCWILFIFTWYTLDFINPQAKESCKKGASSVQVSTKSPGWCRVCTFCTVSGGTDGLPERSSSATLSVRWNLLIRFFLASLVGPGFPKFTGEICPRLFIRHTTKTSRNNNYSFFFG